VIFGLSLRCVQKPFELTILGTSSATPTRHRYPSAQYLRMDGAYFLIDCGEGTQMRLVQYNLRMQKIRYILISHLHGDHFFGLPGLLTSMSLFGRLDPLTLVGPPDLEAWLNHTLEASDSRLTFPLHFVPTQTEKAATVLEEEGFRVSSFPLRHRIACTGFSFEETGPELRLNVDACHSKGVPVEAYQAVKMGEDYRKLDGTLIPNAELTLPGHKNRRYAYVSDTAFTPDLAPLLQGADLMYHEATFMHDLLERAIQTFHSTSVQAAEMANLVGCKRLLVGHFSARYSDLQPLLEEARTVFPGTELAIEGLEISL